MRFTFGSIFILISFFTLSAFYTGNPIKLSPLYEELEGDNKPDLALFEKAYLGYIDLKLNGQLNPNKEILTIIDFRRSSNEKRMWVIDLKTKKILHHTYVAHGENSGKEYAVSFSNQENSHKSSLGFYLTKETYYGKNGLSLRLEGLERKFNSNARKRYIVLHGADYANPNYIKENGILGNSEGCPAIPMEIHKPIIELTKNGTCLFIYYPNINYLEESNYMMGIY